MDDLQKAKESRDRIATSIGAEGYDEACRKVDGQNWLPHGRLLCHGRTFGREIELLEEDLTDLDYIW